MNQEVQLPIQEALQKLLQCGFQECTEAASRDAGTKYLCAFKRLDDEQSVYYCCETVDDLFALLFLVEESVSPCICGQ
jgi:hypothetical protein